MMCNERPVITKRKAFFDGDLKEMAESKNLSETARKHWRHKPYECDFGGRKDE